MFTIKTLHNDHPQNSICRMLPKILESPICLCSEVVWETRSELHFAELDNPFNDERWKNIERNNAGAIQRHSSKFIAEPGKSAFLSKVKRMIARMKPRVQWQRGNGVQSGNLCCISVHFFCSKSVTRIISLAFVG